MTHSSAVLEAPVGTVNRSFITEPDQVVTIDGQSIFSVKKLERGGIEVKPLLMGEPIGFCDHFCRPVSKSIKIGEEGDQFFVARGGRPVLSIGLTPMMSGRVRVVYSNRQDRLAPVKPEN